MTLNDRRPAGSGSDAFGTEDAATVLFETDQGAWARSWSVRSLPGARTGCGSHSTAPKRPSLRQEAGTSLWVGGRATNQFVMRGGEGMSEAAGRYSVLPAGHPQGYQDCFNAFVADTYTAIAGGQPDGLPRFADGMRAAILTQAVVDSATGQTWVEVPA